MKMKVLSEVSERTLAVILEKGDEAVGRLTELVRSEEIRAGRISGIGAFESATLGFFDRERKEYKKIVISEQVEVLSLTGDVALVDGEPKLHLHVVLGKADGTAHGGHLLEAKVWPTLEVLLVQSPRHLSRTLDPETNLPLIDPDAGA